MVSRSQCALALAMMLEVGFAPRTRAQNPHHWSADATIGDGVGRGGEYFNNDRGAAHLGVAERMLQAKRLAVYVAAGYDWLGLGVGGDAVCVISSRGGCRPRYPDIRGPSVTTGVLVAPWTRVEARVGVGGAAYPVDDTRFGAAVGQFDAAVFPVDHLGVVLGARFTVVPRYRHDRLTMNPVLLGLRVR